MIRPYVKIACGIAALGGSSIILAGTQPALAQQGAAPATTTTTATATATDPASPAPSAPYMPQLAVSPLRVEFSGKDTAQTLRLMNTGDVPVVVQSRLFAWSQAGGTDSYTPSSALLISPSIVTIPPGQTQIVRVLRAGAPGTAERAFRLAIDQLPDPRNDRATTANTRIRFLLPLFVDRDRSAPPSLAWSLAPGVLRLTNSGGQTARITDLSLTDAAGGKIDMASAGLRYVQGGATISWPLETACRPGGVRLAAVIDGQQVNVQPASCS